MFASKSLEPPRKREQCGGANQFAFLTSEQTVNELAKKSVKTVGAIV